MSDASVPFVSIKIIKDPVQEWEIITDPVHEREIIQAPVQEWEIIKDPVTITIYCINPSGKLKLWFDRTTKNIIILNHEPHAHTHS